MALLVMAVIIALSLVFGAELGPKVNPTTTTYVPRPDWYFFFLFEVLRVMQVPKFTAMATIGVPTICMILLFLLPLYDRSPERRSRAPPDRAGHRPRGDRRDGAPDLLGRQHRLAEPGRTADAGGGRHDRGALQAYKAGELVVGESGCLACHKIGDNGNNGPGPTADPHRRRICRPARSPRRW